MDVIDIEPDAIGEEDVLLRMRSASICGSDLGFYNFTSAYQKFAVVPVTMGHEFAGEVLEAGKRVESFGKGDRASAESVIYCGKCEFCKSGMTNICKDIRVFGMHRNGGFAENVVVNQKFLHHLPEGLNFVQAGVVEPLSVVVNAIEHVARQVPIKDAAVIGPGPLGLFSAEVLREKKVSNIVILGIGIDEFRLEIAESKLGYKAFNSEKINSASIINESSSGLGFDIVVVAAGAPAAMRSALSLVKKGGQIIVLGIFPEEVTLPLSDAVRKQISISGAYGSAWPHYERAISLLSDGSVRAESIVTHRFKIDEAKEAFETAKSKRGCKVQFAN